MADRPDVLPLTVDEVPEISDALILTTVLMRAVAEWQAEIAQASRACADAAEGGDMVAMAAACRAFASVRPAVDRMPGIAREGVAAYATPGRAPPLPDPSMDARTRRALSKVGPWMEKRWLPLHAVDAGAEAVRPRPVGASTEAADRKSCRKALRARLRLLDSELVRLSADPRDIADTARRIMVDDRNSHAGRCRACGACRMSRDDLTLPLLPPD